MGNGIVAHNTYLNGSVGIGISSPATTSLLDLTSTAKDSRAADDYDADGRDRNPATGLTIYNTTTNAYNVFNGTSWGSMGGDRSGYFELCCQMVPDGSTLGNSIIFDNGANVGIGTTGPSFHLDVKPGTSNATLRVGSWAFMENVVGTQAMFSRNAYYDGTWKYANTGYATAIRMNDDSSTGDIRFHLSPSGTAGGTLQIWMAAILKW